MEKLVITELTSMREILEMAIEREKKSLEFYRTAATQATTKVERELFERLAEEEVRHHEQLTMQLEGILAQMEIDRAITGELF